MCDHLSTVVTSEDEEVCIDCGVIISKHYQANPNVRPLFEVNEHYLQNKLLDVCFNMHVPIIIVDNTMKMFQDLKKLETLKNFSEDSILVYALYNCLIKENVTRSAAEVSYFFGTNPKIINSINELLNQDSIVTSKEIAERYLAEMEIPWASHSKIFDMIEELEEISSAKPETIIACSVSVLVDENAFRKRSRLTVPQIGRICGVSPSAIRALKKMRKDKIREDKKRLRDNAAKSEDLQGMSKVETCLSFAFSSL